MISVTHIKTQDELKEAFKIREKVYIEEQQIAREEEFDEFDSDSIHFLAVESGVPCGTSRYSGERIKREGGTVASPP